MAKRRFGMHAGAHRSGAPKGERNGNYFIGNSLSKSPLPKASLLTRPDVRKLMETAPGSVHPSVMVCGTVAFRDRRVPAQVTFQGRDPPNSPRVEASLFVSAGLPIRRMGMKHCSV